MNVERVPIHERRARLRRAVQDLATSIAGGLIEPDPIELQALAEICDGHTLHVEAARIRRWLRVPIDTPIVAVESLS